jgi:glycosyltransferase involved in cell wall biosynthesis
MLPKAHGVGGMVSFQAKLEDELARRGIAVTYELKHDHYDALLVVGGTRHLNLLRTFQRKGIPIYQRLDGINWIHRVRKTGLRHSLRAELANKLLARIRNRWADGIIYQSHFVVDWWERKYGPASVPHSVVHNGVDLDMYTPQGKHQRLDDHIRVLMVEGSLAGGYELGLEHGIRFSEQLADQINQPVELMIVGKADVQTQSEASRRSRIPLRWVGLVPREDIPALDRSAHLFFAADIHPACPNAVIEALACGLPVVGFDTGALKELVAEGTGEIVAYGGDPWKLEEPDFVGLADAAEAVISDQAGYRSRARAHAEKYLGLAQMTDGYLHALGLGDPG